MLSSAMLTDVKLQDNKGRPGSKPDFYTCIKKSNKKIKN